MLPRNKHILIVGGAGFIGSHLCERKLAEGCWVVCVDNLLTGRRENLADMLDNERFTFIKHDVREPLPDFGHVDEIYNLACPASPRWYQTDPVGTMMTSVVGSRNLLELALHAGARIFLASTSEVYGNPECTPQAESYLGRVNPNGPRSCYDEGKRAAESLFCDYNRLFNVDTRIAWQGTYPFVAFDHFKLRSECCQCKHFPMCFGPCPNTVDKMLTTTGKVICNCLNADAKIQFDITNIVSRLR